MPTETEPVDASGAALTPPPAGVEADDNAAATRPFKREKKVYDPQSRPFHRLRSPSYDRFIDKEPNASPAIPSEGKGYDCGCRCPDDYKKGGVFKKVVRYMWQKLKEKMAANNPKALDAYEKIRAQILAQTGHDIEEETVGWVIDTLCGWIEEGIFGSYMRSIPSWVPVNREGYGPKYTLENAHNVAQSLGPDGQPRNQEVEVEV